MVSSPVMSTTGASTTLTVAEAVLDPHALVPVTVYVPAWFTEHRRIRDAGVPHIGVRAVRRKHGALARAEGRIADDGHVGRRAHEDLDRGIIRSTGIGTGHRVGARSTHHIEGPDWEVLHT